MEKVEHTCHELWTEFCKLSIVCWEFIVEHVHYINFGTRDSFIYVIFGIDIKDYISKAVSGTKVNPLALEMDI